MSQFKPEILSPAGDWERLVMAVTYGADAVYLAGQEYGMRGGAGNFEISELYKAVAFCHERGVKVYVTVNTVPTVAEAEVLPEYLQELDRSGADALIISDIGVLSLAKKHAPNMAIHISTQAGVMNHETANALFQLGASRIVLARETTIEDIACIRERTDPSLELEAFCHGSMCVSFSGRCLISNYLTGRDANRGRCAQPCRWKYSLVEEKRPGQYFPVEEDSRGTYILNSNDMCMIEHLDKLIDAGVSSLKIEGRTKSAYYAAVVTNAYRGALDDVLAGCAVSPVWLEEVNKVSHRPYSTGFYLGGEPGQYSGDACYFSDSDVSAIIQSCDESGFACAVQRNKFSVGDELELLVPGRKPVSFVCSGLHLPDGTEIDSVPHAAMEFCVKLPANAPPLSILRKQRTVSLPGHRVNNK